MFFQVHTIAGLLACVCVLGAAPHALAEAPRTADVVIYGGTSAGVAAAVQARRMGKSVILIEPGRHVGGLSISGLGYTDTGNKAVIGGISREFYQRLKTYYDRAEAWKFERPGDFANYRPNEDAIWAFEPHVAERVFNRMLTECGATVVLEQSLKRPGGAILEAGRILAIEMTDGSRFEGKIFIDATYEGDLLAEAGVTFTQGREANAQYGETLNGIQVAHSRSHQFTHAVDPYVIPGDRASGLFPGIGDGPGVDGEADYRIQAYNYRLAMTKVAANRIPFDKPDGYDERDHELLLRNFEAGDRRIPLSIHMVPNGKTDLNNNFAVSTDWIGMNYEYPNADDTTRAEILKAHETYVRGFLWTLQNHPRVPQEIRDQVKDWGYARDEWTDNNHWPYWCYIREARRMVSDYVQTELDCRRTRMCDDPVGMGSYNMDSHNCQRYVDEHGHVRNEGDVQVSPGGPYLISYRAIVPRRGECDNLLVPVCVSSSHIAYGSIRMEPVFMILGQSAATAACMAIDGGLAVQDVPYAPLSERLRADRQVLDIPEGSVRPSGIFTTPLPGVFIDDTQARKEGDWQHSTSIEPFVGTGYLHDGHDGAEKSVVFTLKVSKSGRYDVRLAYTANPNRATNVAVTVTIGDQQKAATINQREPPVLEKAFVSLGEFDMTADEAGELIVSNTGADGYVVVDAVWLAPVE